MLQDSDFENTLETGSTGSGGSPRISSSESAADFIMEQAGHVTQESRRKPETDIVKLAARTVSLTPAGMCLLPLCLVSES